MKVYLNTNINSRGILRVVEALKKYVPANIKVVDSENDADIVVLHVNGRAEHLKRKIDSLNKPYIIIQYALRSTKSPSTKAWRSIWRGAKFVWSYYDLYDEVRKDGDTPDFNFYYSSLGAETIFRLLNKSRKYIICTHGTYLTESVRECILSAGETKVAYLNNDTNRKNVECFVGLSDEELVGVYNQCDYVSGLRRIEGFELPAVEGLLCGARPILFDRPHYRKWYDGLAVFIPEGPREEVIESLKEIFKTKRPVLEKEVTEARKRFDWNVIIKGFYNKLT